ncbi:hypothetical protein FHS77_000917 [Paenochrobactrum gallinarii]|uniref:DUF3102 domain-containing protein n=2 Tax=Paenochrobactrum gallinarii TaxID=643673 RepID=A0A841LQP4_9HYPH|nr:hypothetical protein [Paenochrobactrum gallinarii]MBB6260383.1 hypothetical protein [Paenochrobactrum gallinarii]
MVIIKTRNTKSNTQDRGFEYEAAGLDKEQIESLKKCHEHIVGLGRRSTEQAFDLGAHLAKAHELIPDRTFGKWVKACCGFTDRTARNYVAVHRKLGSHRDKLVELGAASTALFELTKADDSQVTEILLHASETGRLQIKDIRKITQVGKPEPFKTTIDPFEVGGIEGLSQLMAIKIRDGLKSFEKHVTEIIQIVAAELQQKAQGKRILKEQVFDEIKMLARFACAELCNLALPVAPNPAVLVRIEQATSFPRYSDWEKVRIMLEKLSIKEHWPAATALPDWFTQEILPTLQWSISKTAPASLEPMQVPSKPSVVTVKPLVKHTSPRRSEFDDLGTALDRAFAISAKAAEQRAI